MANGLSHGRFDIRSARLNRGLSRKRLATETGLAPDTIRRLEDGEGVYPASAKKVADYFGVSVLDLLGLNDEASA